VETWHILVYTAGAMLGTLAGILLAAALYYLLSRFVFKELVSLPAIIRFLLTGRLLKLPAISLAAIFNRKLESYQMTEEQPVQAITIEEQVAPLPAVEEIVMVEDRIPLVEDPIMPVQEPAEPALTIPELIVPSGETVFELQAEFQYNLKIAREFSGDDLVPLRTDVWDASYRAISTLPGKLQNELENIYAAIKILNNLVWFSTEFHRHSPDLSEQYKNMLTSIADKLNELTGSQVLTLKS